MSPDGPFLKRVAAVTETPTPDLPRGAGGPLRRAAGRDSSSAAMAVVLEPDPLARLLVVPAVVALGFAVAEDASGAPERHRPAAVFVPLHREDDCRRACAAARGAHDPGGRAPLVVGYGAGPPAVLAAHLVHGCADAVLRLEAAAGRPCLAYLPAGGAVTAAGLTAREADALVLLLRGLTTQSIAARLCVSTSTARSHCRAVLRKLGAGDRRALRARLLAGPADAPSGPPVTAAPRFD